MYWYIKVLKNYAEFQGVDTGLKVTRWSVFNRYQQVTSDLIKSRAIRALRRCAQ